MIELGVGHVAGMIALGFFIASQLVPNALAFILSWRLPDKSTAATWSVAASAFQQSHWSWLVLADNTHNNGVSTGVAWAARLMPLMGILLAIGSVVTPLGLYSTIVLDESTVGQFVYTLDTSSFGYGTPSRGNYTLGRICGGDSWRNAPRPCPFSDTITVRTTFPNGNISWDYPYGYDLTIPETVRDIYSSGTRNSSTISNYFDINWRRFKGSRSNLYMNGSTFLIADNVNIKNLVMEDSLLAVEGLVVDLVQGGVGFRNHTVPTGFSHGVEWEEDLLFVEPESVCVDTNTTIDFTVRAENGTLLPEGAVVLTDRGGFVNLNKTYPRIDISDKQQNINLYMRAYKGAWLLNAYTALYFNVTNPGNEDTGVKAWSYLNSEMNKTFELNLFQGQTSNLASIGLQNLELSLTFGSYVKGKPDPVTNKSNPWFVGSDDFNDISILCTGSGNGDYANITNMLIGCGQLRSAPQRMNPGHTSIMDDGSVWQQKIYVCASAIKSTVKTVSFSYNASDGRFDTLNVTRIRDKTYSSDAELPLWGVENTGNAYNQTELNLIWGMVSDEYTNHPNVSTLRGRSLYMPGFLDTAGIVGAKYGDQQNLPGSDFSAGALAVAYTVESTNTGSGLQDYTGSSSLDMWTRWQNLTANPQTAAIIPNLIFTDSAASTVVGTKGTLGPGNAGIAGNAPVVTVTPSKQTVRFNLPFAVPAFLGAFLILLILSVAFAAAIFGERGYARMRRHMQQTAVGRVYTTFLYPDPAVLRMRSSQWSEKFGDKVIDLTGEYPVAQEVLVPSTDEKDMAALTTQQPIYTPQHDAGQVFYQQQPLQASYQNQFQPQHLYHPGLEPQASPYHQGYEQYHSGYVGQVSPVSLTPSPEQQKNQGGHPGLPPNEQQVYQEITQSPQSPQQHYHKEY